MQEIFASEASDDTGLTMRSCEPRAGQRTTRNFRPFLIVCKEQRKRICASMALISFSQMLCYPILFM